MALDIQEFAPVLIPTLNRYNHFKACLESLERCRYADRTTVYIALDYPPSEKYEKGYNQIINYLEEKIENHGFKSLSVIKRDHNHGLIGREANYMMATDEVFRKHDRYIFSEDDNIFSYRFLEYMNLGLCAYKDDKSIFGICGYMHPLEFPLEISGDAVSLTEMSAWGFGSWRDRRLNFDKQTKLVDELLSDKKVFRHYLKYNTGFYTGLMAMKKKSLLWGDCLYTIYMYREGMKCIFPLKSLVKNYGNDGTGMHGGVNHSLDYQESEGYIEDEYVFNLLNEKDTEKVSKMYHEYVLRNIFVLHKIIDLISIFIYKITGKIILLDNLKSFYKKILKSRYPQG